MTNEADQDLERWRALVERGLKGAPFDSLVGRTLEGIPIQPLYTERDRPSEEGIPWAPRSPRLVGPAVADSASLEAHRDAGASFAWVSSSELREVEGLLTVAVPVGPEPGVASSGSRWRRPIADPWARWVMRGGTLDASWAQVDAIAAAAAQRRPSLGVATWIWAEEGGASALEELSLSLASLTESLRALESRGVSLDGAIEGATIGVSVGPELFLEIAKLRALRRLVDRVLGACGIRARPFIAAETRSRVLQPVDRPVNLLRNTLAASAALIGGADGIAVWAHESTSELASRIARNVPLVLSLESFLGSVDDPARGSYYVERLTDDLARAAWERFREVERAGGLVKAHAQVREGLDAARAKRESAIRTRRRPLVGLSRFPTRERGVAVPGLDAWPFCQLRDRAQGHVARVITLDGCPPARIDFAREILAISGLPDEVVRHGEGALGGASIVILAGPDDALATALPDAARALRDAGAKAIGVAGKPGAHEQALRDAGVDAFVFVGADVVTFAQTLLEKASS